MTRPRSADVEPVVIARTAVGDRVVILDLAAPDGGALPAWEPGAHVDVLLPSGLVRQYSLCGDPDAPTWRIAVLREEASRGGSTWILDRVAVGDRLRLAGPRSHFGLDDSGAPALLLAGGIGVTPLVGMAARLAAAGRDFALHYAGHEGRMPFLGDLTAAYGDRVVAHVSERGERLDIPALLGGVDPATVVYCCGPAAFIDAAEAAASAAGLEFRTERFTATLTPPVWEGPFELELALSGITVEVPPERSVLEVMEENGVLVLSSCTEGTCGTCETPVLEGEVDHRDAILTPRERERGDVFFPCVSRAACPRLVVDA